MTKSLLKNKLTIALSLALFAAFMPMQSIAQAKKVAYIQFSKAMDATASQTGNATVTGSDAITRMLTTAGFEVKVYACDANGLDLATNVSVDTEITGADLIIMQETWGSTAAAIRPAGVLGIRKLSALNIPVIYNKSFTFQKGANRAITSTTGTTFDLTSASSLSGQVVTGKENNPLFTGITLGAGNSISFFTAGATDTGQLGIATSVKGLSLVNDLEIGTTGTLLVGTSGSIAAGTAVSTTSNNTSLFINHIPAGTQIGTDPLDKLATKDMITFAFNYGAIAAGDGTNVTNDFLTLWKNAALLLTGQLSVNENNLASDSVSVSPNPTKGLVTVTSTSEVKAVTVFDTTGKQVATSKTNSVDLSSQAKGVYLVNIQTENGATTKKVVVE